MSIRLRAFLYAAGAFSACVIAGLSIVEILKMLPPEWAPWFAIGGLAAVAFNVLYSVVKAQLEYREKLQQMVDQK